MNNNCKSWSSKETWAIIRLLFCFWKVCSCEILFCVSGTSSLIHHCFVWYRRFQKTCGGKYQRWRRRTLPSKKSSGCLTTSVTGTSSSRIRCTSAMVGYCVVSFPHLGLDRGGPWGAGDRPLDEEANIVVPESQKSHSGFAWPDQGFSPHSTMPNSGNFGWHNVLCWVAMTTGPSALSLISLRSLHSKQDVLNFENVPWGLVLIWTCTIKNNLS